MGLLNNETKAYEIRNRLSHLYLSSLNDYVKSLKQIDYFRSFRVPPPKFFSTTFTNDKKQVLIAPYNLSFTKPPSERLSDYINYYQIVERKGVLKAQADIRKVNIQVFTKEEEMKTRSYGYCYIEEYLMPISNTNAQFISNNQGAPSGIVFTLGALKNPETRRLYIESFLNNPNNILQ